jgi:c-di-GMP-binding flagellar brake protein YcgR
MLRIGARREFVMEAEGNIRFRGSILNISGGGMCLQRDRPLAEGEEMDLRFCLTGCPDVIVCRARVVDCRPSSSAGHEIRVCFAEIKPEDQQRIVAFVESGFSAQNS